MHVLLVRHGESYVNLDGWDKGYIDAGLTKLGKKQAEQVANWLAQRVQIAALYTSTMARTLETTAYLTQATGLTAIQDDRLREFGNCYADASPVPAETMPIQYAHFWGTERPFTPIDDKGGESWLLFRVRVGQFWDDLIVKYGDSTNSNDPEQTDQTVVVVCHGGVIEAVFDNLFNVGPHRRVEIWIHNTGIVHWEYKPRPNREPWRLHAHGMVHHLMADNDEWLGAKPMLRDAARKTT